VLSFVLTDHLDVSQKEWLAKAVNLMSGLKEVLLVLDGASNHMKKASPRDPNDQRQTYLLVASCKLFCMTAQARIYMETSKFPIVPKDQTGGFRDLARGALQDFFLIYRTFDQEDDILHLDYFLIVSRTNKLRSSILLTIAQQTCWEKVRELYLQLYPGDLDWYPLTEVSRQIILLDGIMRGSPAGRGVSVIHSMVNIGDEDSSSDVPNLLKEEERLKRGL